MRAGTEKAIKIRAPSLIAPSQYPSDWFKVNKQKPSAVIAKPHSATDNIIDIIEGGLSTNNLHVNDVKLFLKEYYEKTEVQLA